MKRGCGWCGDRARSSFESPCPWCGKAGDPAPRPRLKISGVRVDALVELGLAERGPDLPGGIRSYVVPGLPADTWMIAAGGVVPIDPPIDLERP